MSYKSRKSFEKFIYWIPAILYMALIFYLSMSPAPEPVKAMPIFDGVKFVHLVEYGILSLLIFFGLHNTTENSFLKNAMLSILFTVTYGVTDEIHQSFVPGRSALLLDLFTNFIGASLSMSVLWMLRKKHKA